MQVIHPNLEGPKSDQENFNKGEQVAEKETTEIKIEVCKYQLTEDKILTISDSYGATEGEIEEVAMITTYGGFGIWNINLTDQNQTRQNSAKHFPDVKKCTPLI